MLNTLFGNSPYLSDRIEETGGKASGFDYMRLALTVFVISFHSVVTSYGSDAQNKFNATLLGHMTGLILPVFFSLSGFLVAGSLERSKGITTFLGLRAFRIFPALAVDTIFCALLLGPLLTTLPLIEYFKDPVFINYFQNILGIIHYDLPGVFAGNPSHKVNGQLWTIPYELECYIVLAGMAVFGIHRWRGLFFAIVMALTFALAIRTIFFGAQVSSGRFLVLCFLVGVSIYQFRDKIRWNFFLFLISAITSVVCLYDERLIYFSTIPIGYVTAYLGLFNPHKIELLKSGDYSYGLFLYGYPIQQALVATVPFAREWYGNILLAFPVTFIFAALSWHLVEKRVLAKKDVLKKLQARVPNNPFARLFDRGIAAKTAP